MADDIRVAIEFGAAPDLAGAAFDANPTGFPCRDERAIFRRD
jgi:hypothetical protein